ncbi:hypothetical protein D3C77_474760 [compost metagenome]
MLCLELKIVLRVSLDFNGNASTYERNRRIRDVAGSGNKYFIPRLNQRAKRQINRFTPAHRDQYFILRVILHLEPVVQVLCNGFPQLRRTSIGSITRVTSFQ